MSTNKVAGRAAFIISCLLVLSTVAVAQFNAESGVTLNLGRYPNVGSAEEMIQAWSADQHLYVKGELGVGASQYEQLESWLDENAAHWTVVLMRNANNEQYTSLDRRHFTGMDAVEYALGRGLALRTSFSDLVDSRTGETDGAVFVLFLDERKFSYYASEAQDVRSLGESHWVGELDRPAFRAMRGGGRILDAVKSTITNINTRLTQKIDAEREQEERERRAKQRAYVNLKTDIAALRKSIAEAEAKAAAVKEKYPAATGELTTPPTETWRRALDEADGALTQDNVAKINDQFHEVSHEVEGYLNSYAAYDTFDEAEAEIESAIDKLNSATLTSGRPMANEASSELTNAREAMQKGDRGISTFVDKARDAISRGRKANVDERARIERAEARRTLIRRTMMATAAVLTLVTLGILAWLNRRRTPAMKRAHETFAQREASVQAEMEKVYGLFEQSGEILGDKEKVKKRGYEGTTKKLTDNAFEDVDDLFVMSSEVERVMDEAREMIHPKKITGKISNMFSGSRYEQGVNRISGEPLKFHRDSGGLPLVIQRESERSGAEPPEEVTMTFDKVFEAFHDRTATAEHTLNTIENSLLQVDDELKLLQEQIETTTKIDRELAEAADDDGMFAMPALFEKLLPSAQADFDKADEITAVDPVQSIQEHIPRGSRKIRDALAVARVVQDARANVFPKLNEYAPKLQKLEYNTNWIQQQVAQLSLQADGLMETAIDCSIEDETGHFAADVSALGERARRTHELAVDAKERMAPSLDELERKIADARRRIANELNLPEQDCLHEYEANPDVNLATGRKLFAATQAALQHGGVDAAMQAQEKLDAEVAAGQALVDTSLRLLGEFDGLLLKCKQHHDEVGDKIPRHDELLHGIREKFAKSSLTLQSGDPSFEDPAATVDSNLAECRDALQDAQSLINQSGEAFKKGQLIEAEHMLAMAEGNITEADQRLTEINQHCSKLNAVSRENEGKLSAMQREIEGFTPLVDDKRTMRPTMQEYHRVLNEIRVAEREVQQTLPRDPFHDGAAIDGFSETVANLKARIEADHDAHAEAKRAVEGARSERSSAEQLVNRAKTDGIPDSPATTTNIQAIRSHDNALSQVERELNTAHNDWKKVDQTAARIHSELGIEAGRLRGELQRAQRLAAIFQSASDTVFEATRWTGGFGTRIFGSPGSSELERARQALNRGDYSAMAELARAAQIAAQHAIQRAQREVYRRQREAARRAEAARRRRRRNSINIGGSGGLGGIGGGGGFGGISRGGGGGRSSSSGSRSSGSGFSRSGW